MLHVPCSACIRLKKTKKEPQLQLREDIMTPLKVKTDPKTGGCGLAGGLGFEDQWFMFSSLHGEGQDTGPQISHKASISV